VNPEPTELGLNSGGMVRKQPSWLTLVAFCMVVTIITALGFAILLAGGTAAFAVGGSSMAQSPQVSDEKPAVEEGAASGKTFAGIITDSRCGARHAMDSGKTATQCALMCIRAGSKYALVNGDTRYFLAGSQDDLEKLAGTRARVAGTLVGDTIRVSSISPP
jgi:hypothetical protein